MVLEQEAQQNLDTITGLQKQFTSVLADFKKYYVYYNKNPEVEEFKTNFFNAKGQIHDILKKIMELSTTIQGQTTVLNATIEQVNKRIATEKTLNGQLDATVGNLQSTNNSSQLQIDDSKRAYNDQNLKNWEMILGLLLVSYILASRFESREFIIKCLAYVKSKAS